MSAWVEHQIVLSVEPMGDDTFGVVASAETGGAWLVAGPFDGVDAAERTLRAMTAPAVPVPTFAPGDLVRYIGSLPEYRGIEYRVVTADAKGRYSLALAALEDYSDVDLWNVRPTSLIKVDY